MLPTRATGSPADMVARDFGEQFASALVAAPLGVWQGPVTSGYGVHLVRVSQRVPGHPATLADVRAAVERDWESDRRNRAKEDYYHRLRRGYSVVIEAALPAEAKPGSGSGSAD
jgi:parvulin-like peptidyl-prolyl isomerase